MCMAYCSLILQRPRQMGQNSIIRGDAKESYRSKVGEVPKAGDKVDRLVDGVDSLWIEVRLER